MLVLTQSFNFPSSTAKNVLKVITSSNTNFDKRKNQEGGKGIANQSKSDNSSNIFHEFFPSNNKKLHMRADEEDEGGVVYEKRVVRRRRRG